MGLDITRYRLVTKSEAVDIRKNHSWYKKNSEDVIFIHSEELDENLNSDYFTVDSIFEVNWEKTFEINNINPISATNLRIANLTHKFNSPTYLVENILNAVHIEPLILTAGELSFTESIRKGYFLKLVGYQRKNEKITFYDDIDNLPSSQLIYKKSKLEEFLPLMDFKEIFKREILDNFEEGMELVSVDW